MYAQSNGSFAAPQQSSYEPPSMDGVGYQPPSYEPGPADSDEAREKAPKKKSFMDDDDEDDVASKAEQLKQSDRERKLRETSEAVRKAAEEDGTYRCSLQWLV
jgi:hypothetical protein